jgi:hypothetical protein
VRFGIAAVDLGQERQVGSRPRGGVLVPVFSLANVLSFHAYSRVTTIWINPTLGTASSVVDQRMFSLDYACSCTGDGNTSHLDSPVPLSSAFELASVSFLYFFLVFFWNPHSLLQSKYFSHKSELVKRDM